MNENCSFWGIEPKDVRTVLNRRELGQYNEQRVMHAVEVLKPWWYAGEWCWSDETEDVNGIDLWIRHKIMGWVPFQVKSSMKGYHCHEQQGLRHERKGRSRIPCVISSPDKSLQEIIQQFDTGFRFERMSGHFAKRRKSFQRLKR